MIRGLRLAARLVAAVGLVLVAYFAVTFVQIWLRGREHATRDAAAVLVFGTTEDNGTPSPELTDRLSEALALYRAKRAGYVAVTGSRQPGDAYTEAGVSATFLERHGVARDRVIVGGGVDTWQNVESVAPALLRRGLTTVLTVTDPFHEYRAMAIASDFGLTPFPSPVADSPTVHYGLWRYYLKETLEVGVARVVGYQRLSEWTARTALRG
ncbi:MAG TPA: YdcF family protein [Acidimicrobiales bacterium]|nr:MAG: hypothetical protein B7Z69_07560 [Actinobacteria bacterium 21-73-9]HQU26224.1 YdcF family protein [Acidimicrobiales bacterium]